MEKVNVLLHEAEEWRVGPAWHVLAAECINVEALEFGQVTCAAHLHCNNLQALLCDIYVRRDLAQILERLVEDA